MGVLVADGKWIAALDRRSPRRALIDFVYLSPSRTARSAQVPRPGRRLPRRVRRHPDRLEREHRVHQLVDGAQPDEGRGDRRDPGGVSRRPGRREDVHGDAGDEGRRARPPPRRRRQRRSLRRLGERPRAASAGECHRRGRHDHRGRGLRGAAGLRSSPASTRELAALVIPAAEDRFIRAEGLTIAVELQPTLVYDAEADTFTNIETGVVFTDNGEGSYESACGRGDRARLADARRLRELHDGPHESAVPRSVRPRLRLDVRVRGALGVPRRSRSVSSSRSC